MHTWQSEWLTIDKVAVTFNYTRSLPFEQKKIHYLTHHCIVSKISTPQNIMVPRHLVHAISVRNEESLPMYKSI